MSALYRLSLVPHEDPRNCHNVQQVYAIDRRPAGSDLAALVDVRRGPQYASDIDDLNTNMSPHVLRLPSAIPESLYSYGNGGGAHNYADPTTIPAFLTWLETKGYTVCVFNSTQIHFVHRGDIWIRGA